jgi:hypothetical protein
MWPPRSPPACVRLPVAQHDAALCVGAQRVGLHQALLVDDGAEDVDAATVGHQSAQIQHLAGWYIDPHRQVGHAGIHEFDAARRGHADAAAVGLRRAAVLDPRAQQHDLAAVGRAQAALVAHGAVVAGQGFEAVAAGEEVVVVQAQRAGHQRCDIDARAMAEEDAIRVQQPDLAVAGERAEDRARVLPRHAVEHLARGTGLFEVHTGGGADGEAAPVEHRARRVAHGHLCAVSLCAHVDLRLAGAHLHAGGQRGRRHLRLQQQRRGDQPRGGDGA